MEYQKHLFNVGTLLVSKAVIDYTKDLVKFKLGPVSIDTRLLFGLGSILAVEYIREIKANPMASTFLGVFGAMNIADWLYDVIKGLVAPAPAQQAPAVVKAEAFVPTVEITPAQLEVTGRLI